MSERTAPLSWDANLFLSYIEGTAGRVETLDALWTGARLGQEIRIATSVISVTEVAFTGIERAGGFLDSSVERVIDALWSDPVVYVVEVTTSIALEARRIVRDSVPIGPRRTPMGAIHLATAQRLRVSAMYTFDGDLQKHSGRFGFPILDPTASRDDS